MLGLGVLGTAATTAEPPKPCPTAASRPAVSDFYGPQVDTAGWGRTLELPHLRLGGRTFTITHVDITVPGCVPRRARDTTAPAYVRINVHDVATTGAAGSQRATPARRHAGTRESAPRDRELRAFAAAVDVRDARGRVWTPSDVDGFDLDGELVSDAAVWLTFDLPFDVEQPVVLRLPNELGGRITLPIDYVEPEAPSAPPLSPPPARSPSRASSAH